MYGLLFDIGFDGLPRISIHLIVDEHGQITQGCPKDVAL